MTIDIFGWIEVKNKNGSHWEGVESISRYVACASQDSAYIFGISKMAISDSIAGYRGLPTDISAEVKAFMDSVKEYEKDETNFNCEEFFGFSYLGYDEILKNDLETYNGSDLGWSRLFAKMHKINKRSHNAEDIRVVVWAHW